jgi:phage terminase large subunit-like protein
MNNYVLAYYQAIQDGSIVVGRWIRTWYEFIVKGIESGDFEFNQKKANKAIKFIENFCHHCEGREDLIRLELWQKALVSVLFGILDKNGNRQFREAVIIMARKQGKTLFASAIIAYMVYLDGEYGAKVYCLAPKLEQANIVYDNFYQMLRKEPELDELAKKRRSDIYVQDFNTSVKPIAFNAKKSDGFNPQLVVCDEIASWQGEAGLKQYEVMKSALGARRQPLVLSISTAGYVNDGIYDELIKRCTSFLMGGSKEKRLAPFLYMIDDVEKWNDINELRKSNPNLGVSVSVDYLLEEIAIAEGSLSKKAEFLTKYCNIKQNSSQAWLDYVTVDKAGGDEFGFEDFENTYCVGGIDLSQTTDLTSCCAVIEKNGKLHVLSHFFMPANKIEEATAVDGVPYDLFRKQGLLTLSGENFVDYNDCYNWFVRLVQDYKIFPLKIGYDRYTAQYLVENMKQFGFHMDDVFQGFNLTPVIRETEGLMKDGVIRIGTNNLLKSHLLNSALKADTESQKVKLVKVGTRTRIDGTAALLDAMTVRQKWCAEIGEQLKNLG